MFYATDSIDLWKEALKMSKVTQLTWCENPTGRVMRSALQNDASSPLAYVRGIDPIAPIASTRDKGVFVGTTWGPPV